MKTVIRFVVLVLLIGGFATWASADTTWNINASFNRPGYGTNDVTGYFTVNSGLNGLVSWDMTVTGTNTQANFEYSSGVGGGGYSFVSTTNIDFHSPDWSKYFDLFLTSALTNAPNGTTINLLGGDESLVCPGCGTLVSGSITAGPISAVPEPASLFLLSSGLLGTVGAMFRKLYR